MAAAQRRHGCAGVLWREEFESAYAVWWEKIPYSLGAYGRTPAPSLLAQLGKPDGRIDVGCAGASQRPAWIEGGIQAAWRTVDALHERARRASPDRRG